MKKIIDIDAHALFRALERGMQFGLSYYETKDRAFTTVRAEKQAKRKHRSRKGITYYHYFHDNVSFYVICRERTYEKYQKLLIKTIIIEEGR